jgi:hypothetical protein
VAASYLPIYAQSHSGLDIGGIWPPIPQFLVKPSMMLLLHLILFRFFSLPKHSRFTVFVCYLVSLSFPSAVVSLALSLSVIYCIASDPINGGLRTVQN